MTPRRVRLLHAGGQFIIEDVALGMYLAGFSTPEARALYLTFPEPRTWQVVA